MAKAASATTVTAIISRVFGTGGSSADDAGDTSFSVTTDWQRFTFTISIPSIAGKTIGTSSFLNVRLLNLTNSTFTLDFWGIQLEAGAIATPFKRNSPNIQAELAACQRYYYRISGVDAAYTRIATGLANTSTNAVIFIPHPTQMRAAPTSVEQLTLAVWDGQTISPTISSVTFDSTTRFSASLTCITSGLTPTRGYQLICNNSTSGFLGISAEL